MIPPATNQFPSSLSSNFVDWRLEESAEHIDAWLKNEVLPLLQTLPKTYRHFIGVDFARSGDLSVFCPATEQADLTLRVPFTLELRDCPYRTQQQILSFIMRNIPQFSDVALDARGNGLALAESARQEVGPLMALEVMITEEWYRKIMSLLKGRFEDKSLILPKNSDVLADLRMLKVVKGIARIPEGRTQDNTGKRHGDTAIALAMMIYARLECDGEPWEIETVSAADEIYRGGMDSYTDAYSFDLSMTGF